MTNPKLKNLENAAREQLIRDATELLEDLDSEYDVDVPTDVDTATELVDWMADPDNMLVRPAWRDVIDDHEEVRDSVREKDLLLVSIARTTLSQWAREMRTSLAQEDRTERFRGGP